MGGAQWGRCVGGMLVVVESLWVEEGVVVF